MAQENDVEIQFYLYPIFMIFSIIFLMMTLVAFFVAPEMQNLHGKSIACQSGTLMIALIGLTVTYLAGSSSHMSVCKTFGNVYYPQRQNLIIPSTFCHSLHRPRFSFELVLLAEYHVL
jgi:hypothetical protein